MKILVINVSLRPKSHEKLIPIGLGYIATAMKNAGFNFDLLDVDANRYSDEEVEAFIKNNEYEVVCMGCLVTGYKIIKWLSSIIKEYHPKTKIIVGNSVATSIPNILLSKTKVDIGVMGEGDETIVDLLNTLSENKTLDNVHGICFARGGKIIFTTPRQIIKDISKLANIDFSIFDVEQYIQGSKNSVGDFVPIPREEVRGMPVNTARGCIARCGFCYHIFRGLPYRYRSADSIVSEMKSLVDKYRINYIFFWDELSFFSKQQTLELVQKIIDERLHFYWWAACRSDLFKEEEDISIMKKMKEAGCLGVGFALENADEKILKAMNKHTTVEQFSRQTELLQRSGLNVTTSLVLGYPQETPDSIRKTFDCCIKNKIFPSTGYLLPQPGSPMYDYAIQNGFIKDEEEYLISMGDRQDLRLNMTSMSDEEFERNVLEGVKRCNQALNLGLDENRLIKTMYYRAKK